MSRRFEILTNFYEIIKDIENDSDMRLNEFKWRTHSKSPIIRVSPQMCPAFSVFDFQEEVLETTKPHTLQRCQLFLICEVWISLNLSQEASEEINTLCERINIRFQRIKNYRLGGKVQRITAVNNNYKIASATDRIVSAELVFETTYERNINDFQDFSNES